MAGPLGCPDTYSVAFYSNDGGTPLGDALELSEVRWGRVLDDTSTASATVPIVSAECCEALASARTWCNDVGIFRDEQLVWQGPATRLNHGRDDSIVEAMDVTAWLFRAEIRTDMDFTASGSGPADLAVIADAIVRDALTGIGVDPDIIPYLQVGMSGVVGERVYEALQSYAGEELRELARTGIDFTALGHRLIIGGETPFGRLPQLQDEDFIGELRVVEDGGGAISRAIVHGQGVTATAGGVGDCGKLTRIVKEDSIQDMASAQAEAEALVRAGTPAPLVLDVPDGVQLSPECPIGIMDLVPGVVIPVASTATCRKVNADLRLLKLEVEYTQSGGEVVKVSLAPTGVEISSD